ncbi:MAG: hypothetical protein DRJ40_02980 [Thermoprotei archaeon]|nr:MAG: hypothetical protein DRJ40_02980 [Thermoprotei archaeon]
MASAEKAIKLGRLKVGLRLREIPPFIGIAAAFGPGIVWAAIAQGSGEFIWWPYLAAKYGTALMWILPIAAYMQFFVNHLVIRYTAATGEGIFYGFARIHPAFAIIMMIMCMITFSWMAGYAGAGATALAALTNFPPGWPVKLQVIFWTYVTVVLFVAALCLGGVVYNVVQYFMYVTFAIATVGLLTVAIACPVVHKYAPEFLSSLLPFPRPEFWEVIGKLEPGDASVLVTCIAFAGMGGFFNLMYSYWWREKGLAMARYVGRVVGLAGKPEPIPEAGFAIDPEKPTPEEARRRWKDWMKFAHLDNALLGVTSNFVTIILTTTLSYSILRMVYHTYPKGWELCVVQAKWFEIMWGPVGAMILWIIAWSFMGNCYLGIIDAVPRMCTDAVYAVFERARKWSYRRWYYFWLFVYVVPLSLITPWLAKPGWLIILCGILNFFAMVIYIPALLYLYYVIMKREYPAKFAVPGTGWLIAGIIAFIFYLYTAIWYLKIRFGL